MLPILRVLPVGGVLLAILIFVLALMPPNGPSHVRSPEIIAARGSLIDRDEHPEWRQFLIQAALRRADELSRLLLLPDTLARNAPVESKRTIETKTIVLPAEEPAPKVQQKEPEQTVAGLPASRNAPEPNESSRLPLLPDTPAPNAPLETKATIETKTIVLPAEELAPEVQQKEPEAKVAGLPATRSASEPDPDEITSSIDAPTIPLEIGATSSSELPVVLPPERPPVMRKPISVNRGAAKKAKRAKAVAKPAAQAAAQPAAAPERDLNWLEKLVYGDKAGAARRPGSATGSPPARTFQPPQVRTGAN